jgi:hypothetical protein
MTYSASPRTATLGLQIVFAWEYATTPYRFVGNARPQRRWSCAELQTLLAAAAVVTVGLSIAPAYAYEGGYPYGWQNDTWREHAWREHEWREHAWRRHVWWEQHRWHPGYYQGYYAAPATPYGYYR